MQKLRDFDFTLMITPLLLTGFGLVMIYSSSMVIATVAGLDSDYFLMKQLRFFLIGLAGFVFCSLFPYQYYQRYVKYIVLGVVLLLIGVLLFGETVNRSKSWFMFGPISFQPAEFAKLGLILYLAAIYSKKQAYIHNFTKGVLPPIVITAIVLALIVKQPDIGTAAIVLLIACSIIFSAGIRIRHLILLGTLGLLLVAVAIPNMVTDTRIERFTGAYQPFEAPDEAGYHLIQSYLAIGSGGITGEGLGHSIQKLGYLFGPHTDFIMAIIAEELGFIGVLLVIGFLLLIVLRGIYIARRCKDSFGSLLAIGISSMVGIQAFINLGSISGLLPITGVTLPFISYGGSSLLILMISMGILNNIAKSTKAGENEPVTSNLQHFPEDGGDKVKTGNRWAN